MYSLRGKKRRRKERDEVKKRKKQEGIYLHMNGIFALSVKWESHAYIGPEANVFEV